MEAQLEELVYTHYEPSGVGSFEYRYEFQRPITVVYDGSRLAAKELPSLGASVGNNYETALRNFSYLLHGEFERIFHTPPGELTETDFTVLEELRTALDFDMIQRERDKQYLKVPRARLIHIESRSPYV
ncbi:hypothetical protein HYX12_01035, partial [Candidatus Woesearchaeota archaeon]|nr:hypothetical protein [Candidatus Woesearchaeota archaeon]